MLPTCQNVSPGSALQQFMNIFGIIIYDAANLCKLKGSVYPKVLKRSRGNT